MIEVLHEPEKLAEIENMIGEVKAKNNGRGYGEVLITIQDGQIVYSKPSYTQKWPLKPVDGVYLTVPIVVVK